MVDLVVVAAEEEVEEEEVDLVAEVVAEDLEVRRGNQLLNESCSWDCGVVPPASI